MRLTVRGGRQNAATDGATSGGTCAVAHRCHRALRDRLPVISAILLSMAVAVAVAGCGGSSANTTSETHNAITLVSSTPPPKGSLSSITWDSPYGEPTSLD